MRLWAGLVLCVLLSGCTLSNALRHDEFWSVWTRPGPVTMPLFFATDREPEGGSFNLHWGAALRCGSYRVTIPALWREGPPGADGDARMCDTQAGADTFARTVAAAARAKKCDRVLLFIHGYNTAYRTAILQGAQLALDTAWPCVALAFSWSSEGKFDRYAADIERSFYAVPELMRLLRALADAGLRPSIITHSMGARLALAAATCGDRGVAMDSLVLAAPDISAERYNDDFAQLLKRAAPCVGRINVYASDNDMALIMSEGFHGGVPRAGRVPARDLQYRALSPNIDIIDASLAPGDESGHGYLTLSYEMAHDMMWALSGKSAAERMAAGILTCDAPCGDGAYRLTVAKSRQPDFGDRLLRHILPAIVPVQ